MCLIGWRAHAMHVKINMIILNNDDNDDDTSNILYICTLTIWWRVHTMQVNIVGRPAMHSLREAVMGVCSSAYMKQLSNSTRHTAALLFKVTLNPKP